MKQVGNVPTIEEIKALYEAKDEAALRELNEKLAKRSNQRISTLKKAGLDTTAALSRAKEDIKDLGFTSGRYSRSRKMDLDSLYKQVKSEANFLRWQTSTPTGEILRRDKIWDSLTSQRINEKTGEIEEPIISLAGLDEKQQERYKKNFLKFLDSNAWEELKKHLYTSRNILLDKAGEAIANGASLQDLKDAIQKYKDGEGGDWLSIWDNWTSVK